MQSPLSPSACPSGRSCCVCFTLSPILTRLIRAATRRTVACGACIDVATPAPVQGHRTGVTDPTCGVMVHRALRPGHRPRTGVWPAATQRYRDSRGKKALPIHSMVPFWEKAVSVFRQSGNNGPYRCSRSASVKVQDRCLFLATRSCVMHGGPAHDQPSPLMLFLKLSSYILMRPSVGM